MIIWHLLLELLLLKKMKKTISGIIYNNDKNKITIYL